MGAERSTEEVGIVAKQLAEDGTALDDSWKRKTVNINPDSVSMGTVMAREAAANRDAVEARRKIDEILGGESDPMAFNSQTKSSLTMADLMEGMNPNESDIFGNADNELYENMSAAANDTPVQQTPVSTSWVTNEHQAKLKSGKIVPVWKVMNETTGMEIPKPFRVEEPAMRIAAILNTTGNTNDPRIANVMEAYQNYLSIRKQIGSVKKMIKEGHTSKKPELSSLMMKLEAVNAKLGI